LRKCFEPFGALTKCKLLKGKAFIEYETHEHAQKALDETNDTSLDGRTIIVEFSG
jgi:RNA recognition motif-containing protein